MLHVVTRKLKPPPSNVSLSYTQGYIFSKLFNPLLSPLQGDFFTGSSPAPTSQKSMIDTLYIYPWCHEKDNFMQNNRFQSTTKYAENAKLDFGIYKDK